jgi:hypothetical protein
MHHQLFKKMKSKRNALMPINFCALVTALLIFAAMSGRSVEQKVRIDPQTGVPYPDTEKDANWKDPNWKDPNWKDPDAVMPEGTYDSLPVTDVAQDLRDKFKNAFDLIIPNEWKDESTGRSLEPGNILIKIRVKNATASEMFNAMNLLFESENTPLYWKLTMNGKRPTAVLRVVPALVPPRSDRRPTQRMILFVGELLGDEKSGGMTMEGLIKTLSEIYKMGFGPGGQAQSTEPLSNHLQFHREAQLLIITGTPEQISFVSQTLTALKQKVDFGLGIRRPGGFGRVSGFGGRSFGGGSPATTEPEHPNNGSSKVPGPKQEAPNEP